MNSNALSAKQVFIEKWAVIAEKYNAREIRERVLLLASILAVVYLAWDFVIAQPMAKERSLLEKRFDDAQKGLTQVSMEQQVIVKAFSNDPSAPKRREVARLETQLEVLDKNLQALSVGLLPAEELPKVIYDVLDRTSALSLVGMKKNTAEKLVLDSAEPKILDEKVDATELAEEGASVEHSVSVYKHSVTVSLEGRYFEVRDYLKSLEKLPWKFYWNSIDYQVTNYPDALITLEIYTLSTHEGLFGG